MFATFSADGAITGLIDLFIGADLDRDVVFPRAFDDKMKARPFIVEGIQLHKICIEVAFPPSLIPRGVGFEALG